MVAFKCKTFVQLAVESILSNTVPDSFHLIIVDNGSNDETTDYIKSLKSDIITPILNKENIGFPAAVNQIFDFFYQHKEYDYLTTVHSDIHCCSKEWNRKVLNVLEKNPHIHAICPITTNSGEGMPYYQDVYDGVRTFFKEKFGIKNHLHFTNVNYLWQDLNRIYRNNLYKTVEDIESQTKNILVENGDNSFLTMSRELVEKVGYFDESFFPGMGEDSDYDDRLNKEGYKIYKSGAYYIHHWCSVTYWNSQVMDGRQAHDANIIKLANKRNAGVYDQECLRYSCLNNINGKCMGVKMLHNNVCLNYQLNPTYNKVNTTFFPVN
jgi:GT2 family glycosyltransferase